MCSPVYCATIARVEHAFTCPFCWQRISMVLDESVESQTYIEDCEICCKPIEITYSMEDGVLTEFEAHSP